MSRKNTERKPPSKSIKKRDREKVLLAMSELLHNPQTPANLYEAVAQFVCEQSSECSDDLYHSPAFLKVVLDTVPQEELVGARKDPAWQSFLQAEETKEVSDAAN